MAVSAYQADDVADRRQEGVLDIQFATPNVNYTKTNFTSSNFSIRRAAAGGSRPMSRIWAMSPASTANISPAPLQGFIRASSTPTRAPMA